jgi:uncharacterized protein (TIGR03067 family)
MARLQGVWKQIGYERDVTEPLDEQGWEPRTTSGNTVVTLADGSTPIRGTFVLDPTRTQRRQLTDTFGDDAGKTFPAIYFLEGDRFGFCASDPGDERPREFRTRPGQVLRVSQRETPSASTRAAT